jgi:hypothetical protein
MPSITNVATFTSHGYRVNAIANTLEELSARPLNLAFLYLAVELCTSFDFFSGADFEVTVRGDTRRVDETESYTANLKSFGFGQNIVATVYNTMIYNYYNIIDPQRGNDPVLRQGTRKQQKANKKPPSVLGSLNKNFSMRVLGHQQVITNAYSTKAEGSDSYRVTSQYPQTFASNGQPTKGQRVNPPKTASHKRQLSIPIITISESEINRYIPSDTTMRTWQTRFGKDASTVAYRSIRLGYAILVYKFRVQLTNNDGIISNVEAIYIFNIKEALTLSPVDETLPIFRPNIRLQREFLLHEARFQEGSLIEEDPITSEESASAGTVMILMEPNGADLTELQQANIFVVLYRLLATSSIWSEIVGMMDPEALGAQLGFVLNLSGVDLRIFCTIHHRYMKHEFRDISYDMPPEQLKALFIEYRKLNKESFLTFRRKLQIVIENLMILKFEHMLASEAHNGAGTSGNNVIIDT